MIHSKIEQLFILPLTSFILPYPYSKQTNKPLTPFKYVSLYDFYRLRQMDHSKSHE